MQGLDSTNKQRVAEVLGDPEAREKQSSRESLISDTVKYESGPDGGEEVSMSVEWNGVSAAHTAQPHTHVYIHKHAVQGLCRTHQGLASEGYSAAMFFIIFGGF